MHKKYFAFVIAAALSFFMTPQSYAQETTDVSPTTTSPSTSNKGLRKQVRDVAKEQRTINRQQRQEMKATFKGRLSGFKDARKQAVIQGIDQKLTTINTRRTTKMTTIITKLEAILTRIKQKAATLKTQGINTTALDSAITHAETEAIATAKTNIANQATKTYTINLTTEAQAKSAVGQTVGSMQADLRTLRQSIIAAKQAVMKAATELAKAQGVARSTITPTPIESGPTTTQ